MKQPMFYSQVALATCVWFIGSSAMAKPWWQNPVIKSSEDTGVGTVADPHYINKDESDQHLFVPLASADVNVPGKLYSIPALISGVSAADITPITSGTPADLYGNWKGGAVSDDLKRIITGNGVPSSVTINASLPLTAPWTKDVTVFAITNNPSDWAMDGIDFSHTSEFLFSNIYGASSSNIVKWNVVNLNSAGLALTMSTVFTTSISRIRNVSDYYIGGKDLVYYGEGDTVAASVSKVCVYDPAAGTETVLVTGLSRGSANVDIMNVKVGSVGLGQMHLYIQCNDGSLSIYELAADGKSAGVLVKSFTSAQMKTLLGASFSRIRCIEFTNDEKYAFFIHKPVSGNALLHTIWTLPVETAWWRNPTVKYKELADAGGPHYLNKDESDQYLFLQSAPGTTTLGYLYSIPALLAASSADDVAPIASGTSQSSYGNWKSAAISDDLLRVLTGNSADSLNTPLLNMENASLPLTAPWTKDVTVFAITNDPTNISFDGADFSHTSQFLYSDSYLSPRNQILKWNVVSLTAGGTGLTLNQSFTTSITRIRNVSDYYIGGKDLVYYGEGAYTAGSAKVCVLDPSTGTETVLANVNTLIASDIMNVKVGGVGLSRMHLYVQCDNGALLVYDLAADGKSLGSLVRSFSSAQMKTLLGGVSFSNMRCFEVTDDEKFAFITFHGASGLYVLSGWPVGTVMKAY